jgi:GNAT superfamily N-acetyltransferase
MRSAARDTATSVSAQLMRRWQAIDPLLPRPEVPQPGCGTELVVAGADGQPVAIGTCEHWEGAAGSLDLAWGAARRFRLTPSIAGPDVASALDQLLSLWRDHLRDHLRDQRADILPAADGDTAAVVSWPSRDVDGVQILFRHGFAPLAVIAARATSHRAVGATAPDVRIRRAAPSDIDAIAALGLEVVRFDAHFGSVIERPETAAALRREAAGLLAEPQPWTWLAERDGTAIGMLSAERPEAAGWIAPMARPSPVAYLFLMFVQPGERGTGVGAALAARMHQQVEAAGVAVTLLHYAQLNPLSASFWSQQGYRPLWTTWEAQPGVIR